MAKAWGTVSLWTASVAVAWGTMSSGKDAFTSGGAVAVVASSGGAGEVCVALIWWLPSQAAQMKVAGTLGPPDFGALRPPDLETFRIPNFEAQRPPDMEPQWHIIPVLAQAPYLLL